jgi:hypothetical protein
MHHDVPPADRLVGDAARVPTVDAPGTTPAGRAVSRCGRAAGCKVYDASKDEHPLDVEAGQMRQEARNAQGDYPECCCVY